MNDHDAGDADAADAAGGSSHPGATASSRDSAGARPENGSSGEARPGPAAGLPVVAPPVSWERLAAERPRAARSGVSARRWAAAAASLALAAVALATVAFVAVDRRHQATLLAERAHENATLERTVSALNARLQAIESAKGRDELAEVRRSVGDMKAAAVTSRELSAAITQLTQRIEKLDREQGVKLDKLGQRVDQETTARTADLAARLDKLEKKPAPAAPGQTPPPAPPKFGANVSMDPTGSIERPRQALRGYVVLGAQGDTALVGGRYGERAVRAGDTLPGAGRVERVERQGPNWVVVTEQGLIPSAYAAPF